jgi:hypothetical protein
LSKVVLRFICRSEEVQMKMSIRSGFAILALWALAIPAATGNFLRSGGFEDVQDGNPPWWGGVWGGAEIAPVAARTGTNGLVFYGWPGPEPLPNGGFGGAMQEFEAAGTSNYTFSVYACSEAWPYNFKRVEMRLEFFDVYGQRVSMVATTLTATANWMPYSISTVSPEATVRVRILLEFSGFTGSKDPDSARVLGFHREHRVV